MSATAVGDPQQIPDRTEAVLWLELLQGTARARLIERLAQVHLVEDNSAPASTGDRDEATD